MYGINLLKVAKILGAAAATNILFNKYGAIRSIYQEIVKYSAQQDIAMVKVMMRSLAQRNEQAYNDVFQLLREHFTEEELQDILPQRAKNGKPAIPVLEDRESKSHSG
jgi:hypothetical protein